MKYVLASGVQLFRFFPLIGCYKILSIVPCAMQFIRVFFFFNYREEFFDRITIVSNFYFKAKRNLKENFIVWARVRKSVS